MGSKSIKIKTATSKVSFVPACQRKSDVDIIRERLSMVMSDKELFKEILVKSGVYDADLKLTKAYR